MTQTIYVLISKTEKRKYGYVSFTDGELTDSSLSGLSSITQKVNNEQGVNWDVQSLRLEF